jgi:hypothetical protein
MQFRPPGQLRAWRPCASVRRTSPASRSRASICAAAANSRSRMTPGAGFEQSKVLARLRRPAIKRWVDPGPHTAKLAQEQAHGHGAPAGERIERGLELIGRQVKDRADPPVAIGVEGSSDGAQALGRAQVVSGVAARVEQLDQGPDLAAPRVGDPVHARLLENRERPFRDHGRDASAEQRGGQGPPLDLSLVPIHVDSELRRVAAAERLDHVGGKRLEASAAVRTDPLAGGRPLSFHVAGMTGRSRRRRSSSTAIRTTSIERQFSSPIIRDGPTLIAPSDR